MCSVCVEVGLAEGEKERRRGVLTGLEYEFDHYLERGLLEGVVSHARRERDKSEVSPLIGRDFSLFSTAEIS